MQEGNIYNNESSANLENKTFINDFSTSNILDLSRQIGKVAPSDITPIKKLPTLATDS